MAQKYLALYKDVSRVISKSASSLGTIHFYMQISIKGDPTDVFDVFKIDVLPFHIADTTYFIHTNTLFLPSGVS